MINIDKDQDSSDVMFRTENFDASNKGKAIQDVSHGSDDDQAKVCDKHFEYVLAVAL